MEYIESPSSKKSSSAPKDIQIQIKPEPNKVYIFGKATFGKGRIITEQKVIDDFIHECKQQGYNILYIRDEAHIGTKLPESEVANFEQLMKKHADFILKMTATFNFKDTTTKKVELTEAELIDPDKNDGKWLIKTNFERLFSKEFDDSDLLDNAISKFQEIKQKYSELSYIIKPAMLIQVDNDPTDIYKNNYLKQL